MPLLQQDEGLRRQGLQGDGLQLRQLVVLREHRQHGSLFQEDGLDAADRR